MFAAASLTGVFTALGKAYEQAHPGSKVTFSFAASPELAGQIEAGAPADVFASADRTKMEKVVKAGLTDGDPADFAANLLEIAVPSGNPGNVEALGNLADPTLKVAVCAEEVPCGTAAGELFRLAGVKPSIDTFEPDVKAVLTKVQLGEVDAGLVYRSDVVAAGERVESIPIEGADRVLNTYPIAALAEAGDPAGATAFVELVLSERGRRELDRWGFRSP